MRLPRYTSMMVRQSESSPFRSIFTLRQINIIKFSMKDIRSHRAGMIGCAIGSAVIELTARGEEINQANILYELERIAASSKDLQVKAFSRDAASILRKRSEETAGR